MSPLKWQNISPIGVDGSELWAEEGKNWAQWPFSAWSAKGQKIPQLFESVRVGYSVIREWDRVVENGKILARLGFMVPSYGPKKVKNPINFHLENRPPMAAAEEGREGKG